VILNDVIGYLVSTFTAAVSPAPVGDGPQASLINRDAWVLVGSSGDDDRSEDLSVTLTPSTLGPGGWMDEEAEIVCSSWAQSGSGTFTALRAAAFANAAACSTAVARNLGGLLNAPTAHVSELRGMQGISDQGGLVVVNFTVSYSHVITT